jgi:hypothetical protein
MGLPLFWLARMSHGWLYLTNWSTHIHYRDRGAAWIKSHVADLNDYQWIRLPDAVKGQLQALRYLAARGEGKVPDDPIFLASQCGCTEPLAIDTLLAAGFLSRSEPLEQLSSKVLAKRYPHREIERKKLPAEQTAGKPPLVALTAEEQAETDARATAELEAKAAKIAARKRAGG